MNPEPAPRPPSLISQWPAHAPDDEAALTRAMFVTLTAMLGGLMVAIVILVLTDQYPQSWVVGASAVGIAAAWWLLRRGFIRLAGFLALIIITLLASALLMLGDGLNDIAVLLYPAIIIGSSLFLSPRQFASLMALMFLALSLVFYGQVAGWVTSLQPSRERLYSDFAIAAIILCVTGVATYLLAHNLRSSLRRAQSHRQALAANEERYRLISNVSSDYVFSTQLGADGQLHLNWVAGAFESITGYSFEEYVAQGGWRAALHPDDVEQDARDMAALRANQQVITEVRTLHRSGQVRWVRVYGHPVWDKRRDRLQGIYGAVQDITARRQVEDDLRQALAREQRFNEIAHTISSSLDLDTLLPRIGNLIFELVEAEAASVAIVSPDGEALAVRYEHNVPAALAGRVVPRGQGVAWRVIEERVPILLNEYRHHPDARPTWIEAGLQAIISVPLLAGDDCLGVLGLFAFTPGRRFTPRDLATAVAIGRQAGVAIQNARLYEATRRQLDELAVLHAVALAEAQATREDDLLAQVVQIIQSKLDKDWFDIMLLDEASGGLRAHPASLGVDPEWLDTVMPFGRGIVGEVAASGRPRRVPDVRQVPSYVAVRPGVLSELGVPIKIGDRVLGVINLESPELDAFADADERLLTTIAGHLATALERLRAEAELREAEIRYRQLVERIPAVVYTAEPGPDGVWLYASPQIHALLGYTAEAWMADPQLWYSRLHPDDREAAVQDEARALATGTPPLTEYRLIARDGRVVWVRDDSLLTTDPATGQILVHGFLIDITAQKQAEEEIRRLNAQLEARVRERTAELEAANRELEAFSYSVSHDLRAPLRGIDGFARILLEDYAPRLDADGQHYLNRVRENAQRMGQLIDDLLQFSRLGRQPIRKLTVQPARLAQQVLEELRPASGARPMDVVVGDLPECLADPALLRQVLSNLLDNALKYSSRRERPVVVVGWRSGAYFVRDNGVGFDMQHADKLFGVFQRLHPAGEFEGTGVGLAVVQRIIHRHGGRIWCQAEVDRGATFFFTLGGPPD